MNQYSTTQKKLQEDHVYRWVIGEKIYDDVPSNQYLLKDIDQKRIQNMTPVELFEICFSSEIKNYILQATSENNFRISIEELNTFIGILILSNFNQRRAIKDYWSTDPLLECPIVRRSMSRNKFILIKKNLKCSKQSDKNQDDPVWRIRAVLEIFRKNIKAFQFFETAISVDEMMVKFYGRLMIKQFIRNKPVRFGIKMWAVCGADGYLFDCDIYCGKNVMKNGKLSQISLRSRVVLNILEDLLLNTTKKKLGMYHLYCDNFFTSPDLFIHLQQIGLKATGVVRKDRIKEENSIDKKSTRGTYAVKHNKTSGLNFITLMDSKEVSVLSTAAGVQPIKKAKRY